MGMDVNDMVAVSLLLIQLTYRDLKSPDTCLGDYSTKHRERTGM
jgi:hypothetical protein